MASNKRIRPYHFNIEYFRNFKEVSFELGRKITVISGQNGVGKSNLLSLIASGSGVNKKSVLGSNFQPEFYDFFNVDKDEDFENYKLYLTYVEDDGTTALTKRLSFKDDTKTGRGIRIIPRTKVGCRTSLSFPLQGSFLWRRTKMNVRNEVKSHLVCEGVTMQEVLEKLEHQYGWSRSISNLSGKLHRETLRYKEAVELADVLGYEIIWKKRG